METESELSAGGRADGGRKGLRRAEDTGRKAGGKFERERMSVGGVRCAGVAGGGRGLSC